MKLIQRIGYYLGGFSIGLVILAFFLNGKKVSCDYGPEARVLKNINSKELKYSDEAVSFMSTKDIDTSVINYVLLKGDINFGKDKSSPRQKPCGIYYIEGTSDNKKIALIVENCDTIAKLKEIKWLN
jgi:hypothetical protein